MAKTCHWIYCFGRTSKFENWILTLNVQWPELVNKFIFLTTEKWMVNCLEFAPYFGRTSKLNFDVDMQWPQLVNECIVLAERQNWILTFNVEWPQLVNKKIFWRQTNGWWIVWNLPLVLAERQNWILTLNMALPELVNEIIFSILWIKFKMKINYDLFANLMAQLEIETQTIKTQIQHAAFEKSLFDNRATSRKPSHFQISDCWELQKQLIRTSTLQWILINDDFGLD